VLQAAERAGFVVLQGLLAGCGAVHLYNFRLVPSREFVCFYSKIADTMRQYLVALMALSLLGSLQRATRAEPTILVNILSESSLFYVLLRIMWYWDCILGVPSSCFFSRP
jgi:hypothetical protein